MRITVTIPDEVAAQLQAQGMTPEGYVEKLVTDATHTAPVPPRELAPDRDMEGFFQQMARYSDKIPQLPDEAFTS